MSDLINKESLIEKYSKEYAKAMILYGVDIAGKYETATQISIALEKAYMRGKQDAIDAFVRLREEQATVEAVPVVYGEWLGCDMRVSICSQCREEFNINRYDAIENLKFCPNCGAYMRKKV